MTRGKRGVRCPTDCRLTFLTIRSHRMSHTDIVGDQAQTLIMSHEGSQVLGISVGLLPFISNRGEHPALCVVHDPSRYVYEP